MPASNKHSPRTTAMRRSIACLAARLMAEDGIGDYGLAKRKAARQLGAADSEVLPNNAEIEEELRAYQNLYQGQEQRERLLILRQTALHAMDFLRPFKPYLTGPVLDGTAGRFARVNLEVFTDDIKAVEIFLLGKGVAYNHEPVRTPSSQGAPEMILQFDMNDIPISLAVHDSIAERARHRSHDGRVAGRALEGAVRALLEHSA